MGEPLYLRNGLPNFYLLVAEHLDEEVVAMGYSLPSDDTATGESITLDAIDSNSCGNPSIMGKIRTTFVTVQLIGSPIPKF